MMIDILLVCQPSDHGEGVKAEKKGFLSISYLLMCIASISSKPVILKSTVPVFLSQLDSVAYSMLSIHIVFASFYLHFLIIDKMCYCITSIFLC